MFESNKYSIWYFNIINKAKIRNWSKNSTSQYIENHHIVPRSLGGNNRKSNLVYLTAKEHYICHLLLTKFTLDTARSKMIFALICMQNRSNESMIRYSGNSRLFEKYKILANDILKNRPSPNLGKTFSNNTKEKMSIARMGIVFSEKQKQRMSDAQKKKHASAHKAYCCTKCNRTFVGGNCNKHFNICYARP